jgi:hypothetical protein
MSIYSILVVALIAMLVSNVSAFAPNNNFARRITRYLTTITIIICSYNIIYLTELVIFYTNFNYLKFYIIKYI